MDLTFLLYGGAVVWFFLGFLIKRDFREYRGHKARHPDTQTGPYLAAMVLIWLHMGLSLGYLFSLRY